MYIQLQIIAGDGAFRLASLVYCNAINWIHERNESGLVFVILSVLFGLVTALVNSIKRNALKKSKLLNYIHQ